MPRDDVTRIRHMLDAARSAMRFCEGMNEAEFLADEKTQRAVVQCIEVIGEAGHHVSPATRAEVPGVPWNQIIGMRHRVVHAYFDIDLALVWRVVTDELEPLTRALSAWGEQP